MRKMMSRRSALASTASLVVRMDEQSERPSLALVQQPSDAMRAAMKRYSRIETLVHKADRHFIEARRHNKNHKRARLDRIEGLAREVTYELIELPVDNLHDALAKFEHAFPEETDLTKDGPSPDMEFYALHTLYRNLRRLAGVSDRA